MTLRTPSRSRTETSASIATGAALLGVVLMLIVGAAGIVQGVLG